MKTEKVTREIEVETKIKREVEIIENDPNDERHPIRALFQLNINLKRYFGIEEDTGDLVHDLLRESFLLMEAYEQDYNRQCEKTLIVDGELDRRDATEPVNVAILEATLKSFHGKGYKE